MTEIHDRVRSQLRNGEFGGAILHAVVFECGAGMRERGQGALFIRAKDPNAQPLYGGLAVIEQMQARGGSIST